MWYFICIEESFHVTKQLVFNAKGYLKDAVNVLLLSRCEKKKNHF